jgi:hypothetical protein
LFRKNSDSLRIAVERRRLRPFDSTLRSGDQHRDRVNDCPKRRSNDLRTVERVDGRHLAKSDAAGLALSLRT